MKYKQKKGFTLIEMMVVIALIAAILVLVVANAQRQRVKARDNVRIADIQLIRLALEEYRLVCGEYPNKISPTANNGCDRKRINKTFADFLPHIPKGSHRKNPLRSIAAGHTATANQIEGINGYFYSALSSVSGGNGRCYDYHIAAELEQSTANGFDTETGFLKEDDDASVGSGVFKHACSGAARDFSGDDDSAGVYDFRSTNNG